MVKKRGKVIILVGLPGSGKSYLIKALKKKASGLVSDDFMKDAALNSPINREPSITDSRHYHRLISDLRDGKECVISDIILCDALFRIQLDMALKIDAPTCTVKWEFFENNPEACVKNVRRRRKPSWAREIKLIRFLSRKYFPPHGVKPRAVWKGSAD